jgi:hypothetical protein
VRLLLMIIGLLVVGALVYADYLWKRWMARKREERERTGDQFRR